jgi:adenosylcobinamide-phosphate synthase
MERVERALHADRRSSGVVYTLVGVGLGAGSGVLVRGAARSAGVAGGRRADAVVGLAVALACAGRLLRHTSRDIEHLLLAGDLAGARERLPWLVGRDPSGLDESGVAAAVVESLGENTVDAVVAPVFWALVAGAPGVLAHRAVNTMDAMVGHRSERYARFGWASARVDDVMAWVPARLFAALVTAVRPDRAREVLRVVGRDAGAHPSPNAGVAECAVAGALGVELGGPLRYGDRVEHRPTLGDGPRPEPATISRARRLVDHVELVLLGGSLAVAVLGWSRPSQRPYRPRPAPTTTR